MGFLGCFFLKSESAGMGMGESDGNGRIRWEGRVGAAAHLLSASAVGCLPLAAGRTFCFPISLSDL